MGFKPRPDSKAEKKARQMPPSQHSMQVQPFDIKKSEVVCWLIGQPEILQDLFNRHNERGTIIFKDGQWVGSDYAT